MENNQRNSRKRLNSLILLVAFTAVMLIVSTYAWFSAQKNVTIGGLKGTVNVAEGLQISLDAKHWSQEIDFEKFTDQDDLKKQYGVKADGTPTGHTYDDTNFDGDDVEHNIIPSELLPVSTTGTINNGIGLTDMNMYRGIVATESGVTSLSEVITVIKNTTGYTAYDEGSSTTVVRPQDHDYPGYYAIDLFLQNSTRTTESGTDNYSEILQLNNNSKLELTSTNALTTGLQNTVRVAFALYEADSQLADDANDDDVISSEEWTNGLADLTKSNYQTANQMQILSAFKGQNIHDVAIWEPNASDHVQYIVDNYPSLPEFSLADYKLYVDPSADDDADIVNGVSGTTHLMRTYALTTAADTANSVTEIYDWATPSAGLAAQVALQTEKTTGSDYTIDGGLKNLVSVKAPVTGVYKQGNEAALGPQTVSAATGSTDEEKAAAFQTSNYNFRIQDGSIAKIRMYVWLEGQDVDCINYASHGGGVYLDVGLLKDGTVGES